MAWDLRYTSVESGPTGRSGFQFVATTPGTPPHVVGAVTPYMSYRPPPSAPSAPAPDELAAFPVAFAYGREGDHAVLVRCRYTGRDYSGRYGNFSGHAVVAAPQELEGLRPIELWESPVWDGPPGAAPDLVPGTAFDPDSLVAWLRSEGAHDRLAVLLDAVTAALADGHGRVVLVADDAALVARWIALVSYSLPAPLAAHLSFITYTADPESASQLVVGTVPEAWPRGGFRLSEPVPGDGERPGRFSRVIADCWRTGDLDGIDAVGELLTSGPAEDTTLGSDADEGRTGRFHAAASSAGGRTATASVRVAEPLHRVPAGGHHALASADGAAALLALCRGETSVSAAEESAAAALVRCGGAPSWLWPALAPALPGLGFELAAALAHVAPEIAERCVELALADPSLRERLPVLRLRDGLPARFRAALAQASGLDALADVVRLADEVGGRIADDDVTAAAAACARRGAGDIAAAVRATPRARRAALVGGILAGLERAESGVRRAMLTPDARAALGDRDWTRTPRTGGLVLSARADRHEATARLIELEPYGLPEIEELLDALWDAPPTPDDCERLVERLGPAMARFAALRSLTRRVFASAPLDAPETVRLAELIRDRLPELAGPARTVLAHREALRAGAESEMARVLGRMDAGDPLTGRVCASVAAALTERPARSRAEVLAATTDTVRRELTGHWLDAGPGRDDRVDLAEIEVRLHRARTPVPRLTAWGDGLGRFARRHVESALTDRDPALASAWRALRRRGA
ncbi:hypothetical protein [Actinoallomurus sp. CA-142502]|uniref:GAP1-N2 domain-containing protein n=1 Tax=Actinoallomurus sp. CA-142502 TaxID=3239885 RepID=UPI003D8AE2E0